MRLDFNLYYYQYTYTQLTEITKNVLAVSIVLSSVDTSTLKDNTLRVIVQKTYKEADKDTQQKIYDQLKAVLDGGNTAPDTSQSNSIQASTAANMSLSHGQSPNQPQLTGLHYVPQISIPLPNPDEKTIRSRFRRAVAKSNGKQFKTANISANDIIQRLAQFEVYVTIGRNSEAIPNIESWVKGWLWKTFQVAEDVDIVATVETGADSRIECAVGVVVAKKDQSRCSQENLEDACSDALANLRENPSPPIEIEGYHVKKSS